MVIGTHDGPKHSVFPYVYTTYLVAAYYTCPPGTKYILQGHFPFPRGKRVGRARFRCRIGADDPAKRPPTMMERKERVRGTGLAFLSAMITLSRDNVTTDDSKFSSREYGRPQRSRTVRHGYPRTSANGGDLRETISMRRFGRKPGTPKSSNQNPRWTRTSYLVLITMLPGNLGGNARNVRYSSQGVHEAFGWSQFDLIGFLVVWFLHTYFEA